MAARERDALIDNTRFVLIVLVVVGHFLTTMRTSAGLDVAYNWIYMFHMPAFVFLSGLVIGSDTVTAKQGGRIITGMLIPLGIFVVIYEAFGRLVGQPVPSDTSLMDPYWLLWFLVALVTWRLLVPVIKSLRWPVATSIVLASVLALAVDLPSVWSIDRVVILLPFFAAGLVLDRGRLQFLRTLPWRLAAIGVLVVSLPIAVWVSQLPSGFVTFNDGVGSIGDVPEFLGMYAIAAAMIMALLALAPADRSTMTKWGARTIYVYLLHGLFVRGFRAVDLGDVVTTPAGIVAVLAVSVGLAILLSSDVVVRRTRWLVEPKLDWLLADARRDKSPSPVAAQPSAPAPASPGGPEGPGQPESGGMPVGAESARQYAMSR